MESGFEFELYETVFTNCFIHSSRYSNGNLKLSLFGVDSETNQMAHFVDITLEQNKRILKENEIVVDCLYKANFISQLIDLGIIKKQIGVCAIDATLYPVYTIDLDQIDERSYCLQELIAA